MSTSTLPNTKVKPELIWVAWRKSHAGWPVLVGAVPEGTTVQQIDWGTGEHADYGGLVTPLELYLRELIEYYIDGMADVV